MANWLGVEVAACQYGVEVGEVLLWQQIKEISFSEANGTLMVDKDSIETYLEAHAVRSNKASFRKHLLDQEYKLIHDQTGSYNPDAFYVRLQDECFELCPVIVDALAEFINDEIDRSIFRSIIKGQRLAYVAEKNGLSIESTLQHFRKIIITLREKEIKMISAQVELYEQMKLARNTLALKAIWRKECYDAILEKYIDLEKKMKRTPLDPDMIFPREPNKGAYTPKMHPGISSLVPAKRKGFFRKLTKLYQSLFSKSTGA